MYIKCFVSFPTHCIWEQREYLSLLGIYSLLYFIPHYILHIISLFLSLLCKTFLVLSSGELPKLISRHLYFYGIYGASVITSSLSTWLLLHDAHMKSKGFWKLANSVVHCVHIIYCSVISLWNRRTTLYKFFQIQLSPTVIPVTEDPWRSIKYNCPSRLEGFNCTCKSMVR